MENAKALLIKKDEIEKEIEETARLLDDSTFKGGRFIDDEGFPVADYDTIVTYRQLKQKLATLQNDHIALMKKIENSLYEIHAQNKDNPNPNPQSKAIPSVMIVPKVELVERCETEPDDFIGEIDEVFPNSPSALAGLELHDKVLSFGSVSVKTFSSLNDVTEVVQCSVNKPVSVFVYRKNEIYKLELVPKKWEGNGLLGCHIKVNK